MRLNKKLAQFIAVNLACIIVCLFCVPQISTNAKDIFASKYIQTVFNQNNGIGSNEVNCLYQSSSGYIWIGTDSGLYRTNGSEFTSINLWETENSDKAADKNDRTDIYSINCITQDSTGKMWIGTDNYGLFYIEDGKNYHFRKEYYDGVKSIDDIEEASDGTIYVATSEKLYVCATSQDGSPCIIDPENNDLKYLQFVDMEVSGDSIWGINKGGFIGHWGNDTPIDGAFLSDYTSEELTCIKEFNGDIYIGTKGREVIHLIDNNIKKVEILEASIDGINSLMCDSNGYIWACGEKGIGYFTQDKKFVRNVDLEFESYMSDIIQDYEGNYWISSSRMGVLLLSRSKFVDYNMYTGMPETMVNCVYEFGKYKYIGTDDGLIIYEGNKRINNDITDKFDGVSIRHIVSDSAGNIWVGTYRRYGLVKIKPNGDYQQISKTESLADSAVNYILPLKNGDVAVATENGVSIVAVNGKVKQTYDTYTGMSEPKIYCLYEAPTGEIYAGSDGGGIYVINPEVTDSVQNYTVESGLNSNVVTSIEEGEKGLWIGTDNGVCFYNETFREISNIEYSNSVYDIIINNGSIWVISSKGIIRTNEDELLGSSGVSERYLDANDGLSRIVNSVSNSCMTSDGKLYICCNTGVCMLDTNNIPYNNVPPKIKVTSIDIDGVRYEFDNLSDGIVLKSDVSRINIGFAVFSYGNRNDIKVEYSLDGFDSQPIVINGNDSMEAVYTNLDGGVYEFKINAYNSDGVACEQEVSFVIEKEKSILERPITRIWLALIILAVFLLLCFVLVRVKKVLKNKNEALESLSKEHEEAVKSSSAKNDYLANMSNEIKIPINAIMVKADEMLHVIDDDAPYRETVKGIYDIGNGIITKVDDIILLAKLEAGKFARHDVAYSITTLMYAISEDMINKLKDKGIKFFVEIGENIIDNLIGDEEKIRSILTRLLDNSIKHTKDGSITLTVDSYEMVNQQEESVINIEFTVSDTGVGIPEDKLDSIFEVYNIAENTKNKSYSKSGIGLAIAKGYADIIDAEIDVESVYGAGTTFTLSLPQIINAGNSKNPGTKVDNMVSKETADKLWLPDVYALLVDDEDVSREVASNVLSTFELKLDVASSSISAIDMVMNNDYDVVFVDLSMPIMNGAEIMNEIRDLGDPKYEMLPIISMDVDAIETNTAQLISDGFTDNIVKPIDVRRVAAILRDCLPESKIKEKSSDIIQYMDNSRFGDGLKKLKPQIEVERAIEKIGGSIEVYNKLITTYYKQNIMDVDKLQEKSTKDLRSFKSRIHSLRTLSVNIGAYKFAKEAAQMEAAINKRNKEYIKHNVEKLTEKLHSLLLSIEEYIEYMEDYVGVTDEEHAKKKAKKSEDKKSEDKKATDKKSEGENQMTDNKDDKSANDKKSSDNTDSVKSDAKKSGKKKADSKKVAEETSSKKPEETADMNTVEAVTEENVSNTGAVATSEALPEAEEEIIEVADLKDLDVSSSEAKDNGDIIDLDKLKKIGEAAVNGSYDEVDAILAEICQVEYQGENVEFLGVLKEMIAARDAGAIEDLVITYIDLNM